MFPGIIETVDPEEIKNQNFEQVEQNNMNPDYSAKLKDPMLYESQKHKIQNLFSKGSKNENDALKPLGNTFKGNVHVKVDIPKNYQMTLGNAEMEQESFGKRPATLQNKKTKAQLEAEYEGSDDIDLPDSSDVFDALNGNEASMRIENISIMENFEADPEPEQEKHRSKEKSCKTMEDFKPGILTESEDSYSSDRMSKEIDNIVQVKGERKNYEQNIRRKNAMTKINQDLNRILPEPEDMSQFLAVRKPPEEEYFLMTLMTYKLNHDHFAKICSINSNKLFYKATQELKLPFFSYPSFIEKELDTVYMNLMYKKHKKKHTKKKKPLTKLQKKQRENVLKHTDEMYGRMLDDDYDFDDEYF